MQGSAELRSFMERVFAISPSGASIFGSTGRAAVSPNANTAAYDTVRQLQQAANDFGRAIVAGSPAHEKAQQVEGSLLALQTLGQITPELTDDLIAKLYDIAADKPA